MDDTNVDSPDTAMANAQSAYMAPTPQGPLQASGYETSGGNNAPATPVPISTRLYQDISKGKQFNTLPQYMAEVNAHAMQMAAESGVDVTSPKGQQWLNGLTQQARQRSAEFITPPTGKKDGIIIPAGAMFHDPNTGKDTMGPPHPDRASPYQDMIDKHNARMAIATNEANGAVGVKSPDDLKTPAQTAQWKDAYAKSMKSSDPSNIAQQRVDQSQQKIDEHIKMDGTKMTDAEKSQVKRASSDLMEAQRHFEKATLASQKAGTVEQDAKLLNGLRTIVESAKAKRDALFEPPAETPAKETAPGMDEPQPQEPNPTPAPAAAAAAPVAAPAAQDDPPVRVVNDKGVAGFVPRSHLARALASKKYTLAPNGK